MSGRRRRRNRRIAFVVVAVLVIAAITTTVVLTRDDGEPVLRPVAIDGRPSAVTFAAGLVWVADDTSHAVHVFDPRTDEVVGEKIDVGKNPIAIDGDDDAVWVARASGHLVRIDARTRRAGRPLRVGGSLTSVAISPGAVWVTDLEHDDLVEVDPDGGDVRDRVKVPGGTVRVVVAGDRLWVTGQENVVTPVDIATKDVGRPVEVGLGPIGLVYDGDHVWVANSDDASVSAIDADSGEFVDSVTVGLAPVAIAVTEDIVWVVNQDDETLSRINRSDRQPAGEPIELGTRPRGVVAGAGKVWIAGTNPDRLVGVEP